MAAAKIYTLIDPRDGSIRYVGKTIQPLNARLIAHLQERTKCHRCHWIAELVRIGMKPSIRVIEEVGEGKSWQDAERFWIAYFKSIGVNLTNNTSGGDGVPDLPQATREAMRRVWLGRKHSPETIERLKIARRKRIITLETRQKMSFSQKGRKITWVDKIAIANSKFTPEQVDIILQRLSQGDGVQKLATEYTVHRTTISKIKAGTYFVHHPINIL